MAQRLIFEDVSNEKDTISRRQVEFSSRCCKDVLFLAVLMSLSAFDKADWSW